MDFLLHGLPSIPPILRIIILVFVFGCAAIQVFAWITGRKID